MIYYIIIHDINIILKIILFVFGCAGFIAAWASHCDASLVAEHRG